MEGGVLHEYEGEPATLAVSGPPTRKFAVLSDPDTVLDERIYVRWYHFGGCKARMTNIKLGRASCFQREESEGKNAKFAKRSCALCVKSPELSAICSHFMVNSDIFYGKGIR